MVAVNYSARIKDDWILTPWPIVDARPLPAVMLRFPSIFRPLTGASGGAAAHDSINPKGRLGFLVDNIERNVVDYSCRASRELVQTPKPSPKFRSAAALCFTRRAAGCAAGCATGLNWQAPGRRRRFSRAASRLLCFALLCFALQLR